MLSDRGKWNRALCMQCRYVPFTGNLLPLLFPQNHFLQSTSPFSFQLGNATLCWLQILRRGFWWIFSAINDQRSCFFRFQPVTFSFWAHLAICMEILFFPVLCKALCHIGSMVAAKQEAEEERDMTHSRKQHKAFCLFPGSADNRLVVEWISKTGVESGMEMKIKNIGVQWKLLSGFCR